MSICLLCGSSAIVSRSDSASRSIYNCPTCGVFVASDLALSDIEYLQPQIASYMANRKLAELEDTVLISYDKAKIDKEYIQLTAEQIADQFPRSYAETIDRVLLNLMLLSGWPGAEIVVDGLDMAPYFYLTKYNFDALSYAIKALQKAELCDVKFFSTSFFPCSLTLSPAGWDRVSNLQNSKTNQRTALLVYARTEDIWSASMRLAALKVTEDCGYHSVESSSLSTGNTVGNALIAELKSSRLVICNLSENFSTGYYAAAMAHALDKLLVLTCHQSEKENISINSSELNVLFWKDKMDLYTAMHNCIRALAL